MYYKLIIYHINPNQGTVITHNFKLMPKFINIMALEQSVDQFKQLSLECSQ